MCRCPGTGGATLMTTSPPPSSTSSLSLGFQAPWSRVASSAWLFLPRSWPLHWPRMAAVARGLAQSQTIASRSTLGRRSSHAVRRKTDLLLPNSLLAYGCSGLLAVGGRLSTGHLSFVRSTRRQPPRSMPRQRPGTFGRGPPSQSEHRRQSISSPRSLRFAAWYSAAPLAGGLGRSASSLLRLRRRRPSVSGARLAPAPCSTRGPS